MAIPLIIDTDPGVDDAFAIALAARSPEVDLVGLTTVFGNVALDLTTRNAQRLLAYLERTDVPVAKGAEGPGRAGDVHGEDGLGGQAHTLPENDKLDARDAVTFFKEMITSETVVAAIGPLTNIANALESGVEFPRLIVMGGGIGVGNITEVAEYNFWSDPEAARTVVRRANPIIVPLNLTHRCIADSEFLARVDQTLSNLTGTYRAYLSNRSENRGIYFHDAVAVAEAIVPGTLRTTSRLLDVDAATGALVEGKHQVEVAEDTDWPALRTFMEQRLSG